MTKKSSLHTVVLKTIAAFRPMTVLTVITIIGAIVAALFPPLILERIVKGRGKEGDIEKLEALAKNIKATALCGLGQTAPNPVLSTMRYFGEEYEAKVAANEAKNREAK